MRIMEAQNKSRPTKAKDFENIAKLEKFLEDQERALEILVK